MFINAGEFYGAPDRYENIEKLGKFFEKYPEFADRAIVSVKSGVDDQWQPDVSPENLKKGIDAINQALVPLYSHRKVLPKKLDIYTLARVGDVPIEETLKELKKYQDSGEIGGIALSEVTATTTELANEIVPLAAVEVEFSLWSREPEDDGLFDYCARYGIPVVCYSPLGKGLLAGKTPADIPEGDFRKGLDRFQEPVYEHNKALVDAVKEIATEKHQQPSQVALEWITNLSKSKRNGKTYPQLIPIPGSTNLKRTLQNLKVGQLTEKEFDEIEKILRNFTIKGHRYNKHMDALRK